MNSLSVLMDPASGPLARLHAHAVLGLATFFVLIHVYVGVYGQPDFIVFRTLHVTVALALVFLATTRRAPASLILGGLCLVATALVQAYYFWVLDKWGVRQVVFQPIDYAASIAFTVLILEAVRRTVGLTLVVICLVFIAHALFTDHFPGVFYGAPSSPQRLLYAIYLSSTGILGVAVAVMAQFVVLFILFGSLLNAIGGGGFFTRLAFALFGHRTGGPAKAAVISSAMMGSLSGSAIGNVLTTGVFTIPLMIRLGYRRAFAGGVEAAASNGGIVTPPVMGAVAFIMAEFLDRPYFEIILAAAIPAMLYYLVIFVTVHLEAKKLDLPRIERRRLPSPWALMARQGYLALPLVLIIGALVAGYSIVLVAVFVIAGTLLIGVAQPRSRLTPVGFFAAIEETARSTMALSVTAAAAGIILGCAFAVGLTFQIGQAATGAADGRLWLLLLLGGGLAVVMGMGMTAPAIYLTMAATVIPTLESAGVTKVSAHFFAFYYGILSNISPPVALTAFAAAPIAGASLMATGFQASRLGIGCFLLPVLFIYSPALLGEGSAVEIATATLTAGLGLFALAAGMTGYLFAPMPPWQRMLAFAGFALLIAPEPITGGFGLAALAVAVAANRYVSASAAGAAARDRKRTERRERSARIAAGGDGFFARMAARRIAREGEERAAAPGDAETVFQSLMAEEDTQAAFRHAAAFRWIGWGLIAAAAFGVAWLGDGLMHARAPLVWCAAMAAISFALSTLLGAAARRGAAATGRAPVAAQENA